MSPFPTQPPPPGTILAQAVYEFVGVDDSQLSFAVGEYLYVNATDPLGEDDDEDWIFARHTATSEEGFVPSTFLKEVPREQIEIERVSSEIRNLDRMVEVEQNIFNGFQEVLASPSLKKSDRNVIHAKMQDSEARLAELNERLRQFQEFLLNLTQGEEEEDEDDEDDEATQEKPPPVKPFTGVLKSIIRPPNKPSSNHHVNFHIPEKRNSQNLSPILQQMSLQPLPNELPQDSNSSQNNKSKRNSIGPDSKPKESLPTSPKASTPSKGLWGKKKPKKTKLSANIAVSDIKNPLMTGYLWTDSNSNLKSWSRRFFVIKDSVLYIYKKPLDSDACEMMILPSYAITPCFDTSKQWAFKASHPGMATRIFAADDKDQFTQWMNAMSLATIVEQTDVFKPAYRRKRESSQEGLALKSFSKMFEHDNDSSSILTTDGGQS